MAKAKATALRVDYSKAPPSVLKAMFGDAKDRDAILQSLEYFENHAHEQEIFHYINTDEDGEWILNDAGEPRVGRQSLQRQLSALVNLKEIERVGERTSRYKLPGTEVEASAEDEEEADEAE